jgi:hypothetical protein
MGGRSRHGQKGWLVFGQGRGWNGAHKGILKINRVNFRIFVKKNVCGTREVFSVKEDRNH